MILIACDWWVCDHWGLSCNWKQIPYEKGSHYALFLGEVWHHNVYMQQIAMLLVPQLKIVNARSPKTWWLLNIPIIWSSGSSHTSRSDLLLSVSFFCRCLMGDFITAGVFSSSESVTVLGVDGFEDVTTEVMEVALSDTRFWQHRAILQDQCDSLHGDCVTAAFQMDNPHIRGYLSVFALIWLKLKTRADPQAAIISY